MTLYAVPMHRAGLPPFVVAVDLPELEPADGDPGNVASLVAGYLASRRDPIPGGRPAGPGQPVRDGELLNAYYWQAGADVIGPALGLSGALLRRRAAERAGDACPRCGFGPADCDCAVVDHGYHDDYVPGCPLCDRTGERGKR